MYAVSGAPAHCSIPCDAKASPMYQDIRILFVKKEKGLQKKNAVILKPD